MKKNETSGVRESFSDKVKEIGNKALKIIKIILVLLLIAGVIYGLKSCGIIGGQKDEPSSSAEQNYEDYSDDEDNDSSDIDEYGEYTTAYDVAEYIHTYHKLPPNYVKEGKAKAKGWKTNECPAEYGIMIGGRKFGNREKLLPEGETYYECDVDYDGDRRGENRLVYTKDGTVYYSSDHYESFTQLY